MPSSQDFPGASWKAAERRRQDFRQDHAAHAVRSEGEERVQGKETAGCRSLGPRSRDYADPRMTVKDAHVVDMAKKNPVLFIPAKG